MKVEALFYEYSCYFITSKSPKIFVCVYSLHLQRCLVEEGDELSGQKHNHLFSQELYTLNLRVRGRRTRSEEIWRENKQDDKLCTAC